MSTPNPKQSKADLEERGKSNSYEENNFTKHKTTESINTFLDELARKKAQEEEHVDEGRRECKITAKENEGGKWGKKGSTGSGNYFFTMVEVEKKMKCALLDVPDRTRRASDDT